MFLIGSPNYTTEMQELATDFTVTVTDSLSNTTVANQPPRPSLIDILMLYPDYRTSLDIALYGCITLLVTGTITNILTLLVMTRRTLIATSTCFYFAVLAGADLSVLYFSCLRRLLFVVNDSKDIYIQTAVSCRLIEFLSYFSYDISSWVIITMTVDRFIAIRFPLKAASLCTLRNGRIAFAIITVLCAIKNCHFFFTFSISVHGNCLPQKDYVDFLDEVWPWVDATFYSFLPFSLLLVFNVLIIYCHCAALHRKRMLQAVSGGGAMGRSAQTGSFNRRLTLTLLVVSFTFMTMTGPRVILISVRQQAFPFYRPDKSIDFPVVARYSLVSAIFSFLMWTNHSINFFLYCISGKRFRQELVRLATQCLQQRRHPRVFASSQPQNQERQQHHNNSTNNETRRGSNSSVMSEYLAPEPSHTAQQFREREDAAATRLAQGKQLQCHVKVPCP